MANRKNNIPDHAIMLSKRLVSKLSFCSWPEDNQYESSYLMEMYGDHDGDTTLQDYDDE
jgi:hypothetical protein